MVKNISITDQEIKSVSFRENTMNIYARIIFYMVLIGVPANFCMPMEFIGMSVSDDKNVEIGFLLWNRYYLFQELWEKTEKLKNVEGPIKAKYEEALQEKKNKLKMAQKELADEKHKNQEEKLKEPLECAICQEKKAGVKTMFPCSHVFHTACALPWVRQNNKCPICRAEISTDEEFKKECNEHIKEKKELNDAVYTLKIRNNDLAAMYENLQHEYAKTKLECEGMVLLYEEQCAEYINKIEQLQVKNNKLEQMRKAFIEGNDKVSKQFNELINSLNELKNK